MIEVVRRIVDSLAAADDVDHVEVTLLKGGPTREDVDAAFGAPALVPRMPGMAFDRLAYPAPDGVSLFVDVDDRTGRAVSVLIRRDVR